MPKGFGRPIYREWGRREPQTATYRVTVNETDLQVVTDVDLSGLTAQRARHYRKIIETHLRTQPEFQTSLVPVAAPEDAPRIIREMADAARAVGVGPFAAVAGAIAEAVGRDLLPHSATVLIENGGDIFAASAAERVIGIYAGNSRFSGKIGIKLSAAQMPCGACTSSGTVGHSLSFGKADAVTILAQSAALADACATAVGNMIRRAEDIEQGFAFAAHIEGVFGAAILLGEHLGAWGGVEFVSLSES